MVIAILHKIPPVLRQLTATLTVITMKLDIFGRMIVEVIRDKNQWVIFRLGNEGKKRILHDIKMPNDIPETELIEYIEDIYHEWATPNNHNIKEL